ncbi:MAG: IS66 family transposase, partial [Desulfatibacillaceae bacterium]
TRNEAQRRRSRFSTGCYWKRSLGTQSEKGDRWVVRIFSLRPACRLRGIPAYPQLVQAISDYLKAQPTDVAWVADLG